MRHAARYPGPQIAEGTALPIVIVFEAVPTAARLTGIARVEILIHAEPVARALLGLLGLAEPIEEAADARLRHIDIAFADDGSRFAVIFIQSRIVRIVDIEVFRRQAAHKFVPQRLERPRGGCGGKRARAVDLDFRSGIRGRFRTLYRRQGREQVFRSRLGGGLGRARQRRALAQVIERTQRLRRRRGGRNTRYFEYMHGIVLGRRRSRHGIHDARGTEIGRRPERIVVGNGHALLLGSVGKLRAALGADRSRKLLGPRQRIDGQGFFFSRFGTIGRGNLSFFDRFVRLVSLVRRDGFVPICSFGHGRVLLADIG